MDRVSDEWLDEQISLYDHLGDEISDLGKERCAALVELRDRRAADDPEDAEYASYEASKAQAEQLAAMTAGQLERLGSGVMFELMRRAAEREQAAPEPRKLAKWERRLDRMGHIHLAHNPDPPESEGAETWFCLVTLPGDDFGKSYAGETAKAAIAAAWKAWKEARGDA